jgi:Ser/Thr protein kinase RdoA (MazF antagonist)
MFGLAQTHPPEFLTGGVDNYNLKVSTDAGVMVVRFYNVRTTEAARDELAFAEWLANHGYPTPMPLRRPAGGHIAIVSLRPVAIFPFVEGSVSGDLSVSLARELGYALARLHKLTLRYRGRIPTIDRIDVLRRAQKHDYGLPDQEAWHASVLEYLAEEEEWLEDNLGRFASAAIHHDLHATNVIMRDGGLAAVLDFDELIRAPVVLDVLCTLHSFARRTANCTVRPDLAAALFKAYDEVRRIPPHERKALSRLFDLTNISETASFLAYGASQLQSVRDCHSYSVYLANRRSNLEELLLNSW